MTEPWQRPATPPPPPLPFSTPGRSYPPAPPAPYSDSSAPPAAVRNHLGNVSMVVGVLAVILLVTAIVALLALGYVVLGAILGLVAVVTGWIALRRINRGGATNRGATIIGIALGIVAILAAAVFIAAWTMFLRDYVACVNRAGPDKGKVQQCGTDMRQHLKDRYNITLK